MDPGHRAVDQSGQAERVVESAERGPPGPGDDDETVARRHAQLGTDGVAVGLQGDHVQPG